MRMSILLSVLLCITQISHARVGDEWEGRRGDLTPGFRYNAAAVTNSGRIVAVGGGQLMISDDGGTTWDFRQIEVSGVAVRGHVTDIVNFNGKLVALYAWLEDAPSGSQLPLAARTYILTSSDNGNTWINTPFPHTTVNSMAGVFYGVNLSGLHVSPGGKLIAYGTTTVCSSPVLQWMIGGLIYYSSNGSSWDLGTFSHGALFDVTDAGGRMVATGFTTVMDSADGAGWNGYKFGDANVQVSGGSLLPYEKRRSLFVTDIEYVGGNYVAQAARLIPLEGTTNVYTGAADKLYTLISPNPFDGGRLWTAYEQSRYFGRFWNAGSSILAVGAGAYSSGNGQSFSLQDATVNGRSGSVAQVNSSTFVSVGSSNEVWKTTNSGGTWAKLWNKVVGPDLRVIANIDGTIFAKANNRELWASTDNGETWALRNANVNGTYLIKSGNQLILPNGTAASVNVSDDFGVTWKTRTVNTTSEAGASAYILGRTPTGRLILAGNGRSASGDGKFYVSDDNGDTWSPRNAHIQWSVEDPASIVVTKTGRIIVPTNTIGGFDPRLVYSDDNGETWKDSFQLKQHPDLDPVSNDPSQHVVEILKMQSSPTGRVVMLGDNEILTSDDNGDSWQVRINQSYPYVGPWLNWNLFDIVYSGGRWMVSGYYVTPYPQSRNIQFILTSDDDGTTWRTTLSPVKQSNTFLYTLLAGDDGRIIASGGNAAVYTTDTEAPPPAMNPPASIREGTIGNLTIDRPPFAGVIQAAYTDVPDTAKAGTDYNAVSGDFVWQADDMTPKVISITTIDNAARNNSRQLTLQVAVNTGSVESAISLPIDIEDDDGGTYAGILFDGAESLYTTEAGGEATVKISLERKPTANVQLDISGTDATEGVISGTSFLFTPDNWNVQQTLVITGLDDDLPDGDVAYDLSFAITSDDTAYSKLPPGLVSVINIGDEPYEAPTGPVVTPTPTPSPSPTAPSPSAAAPSLSAANKFTSKGSKAKITGTFSGVASKIEVKVGKGKFKPATLAGGAFVFKAKKLPDHGKVKAIIQVTFSNGQVLTKKVKIIIK
jgi:BNR repeat-like domain